MWKKLLKFILGLLLKATQYFCQIKYVHRPFEQGILTKKDGSIATGLGCFGCFCIMPCIHTFNKLDTRIQMFDLPKLRIFSKDGIRITVNGQVYYRILNPRGMVLFFKKKATVIKLKSFGNPKLGFLTQLTTPEISGEVNRKVKPNIKIL